MYYLTETPPLYRSRYRYRYLHQRQSSNIRAWRSHGHRNIWSSLHHREVFGVLQHGAQIAGRTHPELAVLATHVGHVILIA